MTPRQVELARHTLGLPNRRRTSYRNYFVAGPRHKDYEEWLEMVKNGDAIRRKGNPLSGGDIFHLTPQGAFAALKRNEKLEDAQ